MMCKEVDIYLKKLYYLLVSPRFYAGKNTLCQTSWKNFPKLKLTQIENCLSKQLAYTLHRPVHHFFQMPPVVVG